MSTENGEIEIKMDDADSFVLEKREEKNKPIENEPAALVVETAESRVGAEVAAAPASTFREGTRIDLGEDLIAQIEAAPAVSIAIDTSSRADEPVRTVQTEDQSLEGWISKASILMNENFLEDAKKLYRKIIFHYGEIREARSALDEIQAIEVKGMMSNDSGTKSTSRSHEQTESPQKVLEKLEQDLRIAEKPFHLSADELAKYQAYVLSVSLQTSPRDRIDLGVAFYEMGIFQIAQAIFETVVRYEEFKIEGTYLLALALIANGQAIQATLRIEPLVRDLMISESKKTDLLYLMGVAFESLNDKKKAKEFYRRVYQLNPKYRDVSEKLR